MIRRILLLTLLLATPALAQPAPDTQEAGRRFAAGVTLYNEADYRAALVEFKRAYDLAPNPRVLYNIGQTYYQLQNYAAAFETLSRYMSDAGDKAPHAAEVKQTLETLRTRIGKIDVVTEAGAEVAIDDEAPVKAPFSAPVLVSVGRHRITVTAPGKLPATRVVDIAAGDTVRQEIVLASATPTVAASTATPAERGSSAAPIAWTATGVLAVGAITMGVLAFRASSDLEELRGMYPVSADALADGSSKVKRYALLADGLGLAAVGVGVTALVLSLRGGSSEPGPRVSISPRGILVGGSF